MADLTRAEELAQTIDKDAAFQAAIQAAPTATAKRQVLDARGFQDIDLEDMKAYVESKGGTLVAKDSGRELSEQELAAVAGGMDDTTVAVLAISGMVAGTAAISAAAAA